MNRLRTVGLAAVLAMIVAACSNGPASSPSPSATPIATASASASTAASATASASGSSLPSFELPSNAKDLEALLPNELGGAPLTKFSMTGADFMTQGDSNKAFTDFLQRLGAQPDDISVASAFSATTAQGAGMFAFRVKGADSGKLTDEFKKSVETDTPGITWSTQTLAGKSVQVAATGKDTGQKTYLYVREDIVFAVIASDDATAGEALSKLP